MPLSFEITRLIPSRFRFSIARWKASIVFRTASADLGKISPVKHTPHQELNLTALMLLDSTAQLLLMIP
jgi:hypothetical protein